MGLETIIHWVSDKRQLFSFSLEGSRGRDAGYPAPPAQTRTCGFPASGSSVILAFAQDKSIKLAPFGVSPPLCGVS